MFEVAQNVTDNEAQLSGSATPLHSAVASGASVLVSAVDTACVGSTDDATVLLTVLVSAAAVVPALVSSGQLLQRTGHWDRTELEAAQSVAGTVAQVSGSATPLHSAAASGVSGASGASVLVSAVDTACVG